MSKCTKDRFRSREAALAKARDTRSKDFDFQRFSAYRCPRCRFSDGQRAWHWGYQRLMGPRP